MQLDDHRQQNPSTKAWLKRLFVFSSLCLSACQVPGPYVQGPSTGYPNRSTGPYPYPPVVEGSHPSVSNQPSIGSQTPNTDRSTSNADKPKRPLPSEAPTQQASHSAVIALAKQAETQANQGDYSSAAAKLERAIRIEPSNPSLYLRLAHIRNSQQRWVQAEQIARKGLIYSQSKPHLQKGLWLVIAESQEQRGLKEQAKASRQQAESL